MAFHAGRKKTFLIEIRQHGRKAIACHVVGVSSQCVNTHINNNTDDFGDQYEESMRFFRSSLVSEAVRRGVTGYDEPIYSRGLRVMDYHPDDWGLPAEDRRKVPATIRKFSDSLLHALLKANHQEFADKSVVEQHNIVENTMPDLETLTPDQTEKLTAFLDSCKKKKDDAPDVS